MTTRKILIATPVRLGVLGTYMAGLVPTIQRQFPGVQLEHCMMEGLSVNFARNEMCHYALSIGAREIVFIDDDMAFSPDSFARLISHADLDVVAGLYCKRLPGTPRWLLNIKPGAKVDQLTQLCEVDDIATGFMKIRVDTVLTKFMKEYPEREYYNKPEDGKPQTAYEFFPMGIFGPRSPESRLKKIKGILAAHAEMTGDGAPLWEEIHDAIHSTQEPGNMRGEDYAFCHLVRALGFKVYADFGLPPIPHVGKIAFPITPEMVGLDPSKAKQP